MFYIGWIILTATGILVSIAVFIWAIRTGQFADQGRARYLPLNDERPASPVVNPSRLSVEVYVLIFVLGLGLLAFACPIALILFRLKG